MSLLGDEANLSLSVPAMPGAEDNMQKHNLLGFAIAALLVASAGCGQYSTADKTAKVSRKDLVGYSYFDGKVFAPAGSQGVILAPYDIAVSEVLTSAGKKVGKDQVIVRLAMPSTKVAMAAAAGNLKAAQSAYAAARTQYDGPVKEAAKALEEARAAEKAALALGPDAAPEEVARARQDRIDAEAVLARARAEVENNVSGERAAVVSAQAGLAEVRAGATTATLRSPVSGTVVSLEAKPGMPVKAKQHLATIVNLDMIQIQGTVPPELADKVKKGSEVLIALDGANSDPFTGEVVDVSILPPSEGQSAPGYLAVIKFDNSKGIVLPGAAIKRLGVPTGKVQNALVVPVEAVFADKDGRSVVQVDQGGKWAKAVVETGVSDGALIEIKSGLKEGDTVRV
ncbi:MAG: efflux RND transporter periplasmic adaptor subunit [Armatimonadetes bacterium]|nr:efflux RND transporter periplasmic adaptor subunit [Armatimonadota bacterium]